MIYELDKYEGSKFCVVLVKVPEEEVDKPNPQFQVRCLHGRANVEQGVKLTLEYDEGQFVVPRSCYNRIMPSDGTEMLEDAEYFVMCKVQGMDL